ncbi:MAG: glycosyltransferase family 4 protein [Candidatus Promineifilaceae bacterium]|nr:glycosyltransferase family 4 protein [Candidatus Promineifilaceae bacterium]
MKILLLTPQPPYPPHQGPALRNYHIIRALAARHEIHLLTFLEPGQLNQAEALNHLRQFCAAITSVPTPHRTRRQRVLRMLSRREPDMAHRLESSAFASALVSLLQHEAFDLVHVEGIEMAHAMPLLRRLSPQSQILFDDYNVEAALQWRAFLADVRSPARWPAAAYSLVQAHRLRRYEAHICRLADHVTVTSDVDRAHLQAMVPGIGISVIPNTIDVARYARRPAEPLPHYDVVYTGKMDYRPNVDAMLWFEREIWPHVRAHRPDATWAIVGQKPHPRLNHLREREGVTVTGYVPEVLPYLAGARVYTIPLRVGSGTRLKLVESMAAGRAVVSTRLGVEGYPVEHGRHLLLADDPRAFADAVLRLLADPDERRRLGAAARTFAARYDWRQLIPRFDRLYAALEENQIKRGAPASR